MDRGSVLPFPTLGGRGPVIMVAGKESAMSNIRYMLVALCFITLTGLAHAQEGWDASRSKPVCIEPHDQQSPAVSRDEQLGVIVV